MHDIGKLRWSEFWTYAQHFYGDGRDLDGAWLMHIHRNDHHWQHWILRHDGGGNVALPMTDGAVREMVADWIGMAGDGCSALNWYAEHATEMQLHPTTRIEVLRLLSL